ncbi:MAG: hypothetical protein EA397_17695 [Deltaproteobacteria bacterium]|nr:MAG: hypothetical protein EA397_17695 [Deltaproteobacteria bacterium]
MAIIGTQYQARGKEIDTILHLLDVKTQQIQSVPLSSKHRVQRATGPLGPPYDATPIFVRRPGRATA